MVVEIGAGGEELLPFKVSKRAGVDELAGWWWLAGEGFGRDGGGVVGGAGSVPG